MKNLKQVLFVCLLLTSCIKSYSFTFLEILVGNVHKEMVIFVPDSLYHDQSNVLINTDIYGGVNLDTTLFSDQLILSDTSYFEYLGYVIIDPSDSLGSMRHAYRLKTSFLSVPSAIELVYYDLSVMYNEEWIVQFSNMHKTCQTFAVNCQNRYVSYLESIMLPDFIYGSGGLFPISGYDDPYAELDSDKQEVIRTVLNWINGTSHTIAEYSSLLDVEKFLWSDLPEGFCSDQSSFFACTNQTDLAIFMSDFISGLKEIPVPITDYDVFYDYTRLLRGFSAQCRSFGDYQVDVFTNADDTGYEIHLMPLLAGHPQIHAKVIFEGDSIYDKVAYAYRPLGRVGLNYDTLGSFSIVTYYQEANLQDECPFSPSVCLLPAGLSANQDTLYSGYLATFTAIPASQSNYKFYVNNVLKQDSSIAQFKTHTLVNGDSVKVKVRNVDGCESSFTKNIFVVTSPAYTGFQLNSILDSISVFAGGELTLSNQALLGGNVTASSIINQDSLFIVDGILSTNTEIVDSITTYVYNQQLTLEALSGEFITNLSQIADSGSGNYFLTTTHISNLQFGFGDDTSAYHLINVPGNLILDSISLGTNGCRLENIIWNIKGDLTLNSSRVIGTFLVGGNVTISNSTGNSSIYALHDFNIINSSTLNDAAMLIPTLEMRRKSIFYATFFSNSESLSPTPSSSPSCNLIKNPGFESGPNPSAIQSFDGFVDFWREYESCPRRFTDNANTPDVHCVTCLQGGPCSETFVPSGTPVWAAYNGIPNNFTGSQSPHTVTGGPANNRYISLFNREELQTTLNQQLLANKVYYLEGYIAKSGCQLNASGSLEFHLSNHTILNANENHCCQLAEFVIDQSTGSGWQKYTACFTVPCSDATGLRGLSLLSNYTPEENNSRFYLDDLKLIPLANLGPDIVLAACTPNKIIKAQCPIPGAHYSWNIPEGVEVAYPCGTSDCDQVEILSWGSGTSSFIITQTVSYSDVSSECTDSDAINVIISTTQPTLIIPQVVNLCNSSNYQICVSSSTPSNLNAAFEWTVPAGITYTLSSNNTCISLTNLGIYEGSNFQLIIELTDRTTKCKISKKIDVYPCCNNEADYQITSRTVSSLFVQIQQNNIEVLSQFEDIITAQWINSSGPFTPANLSVTLNTGNNTFNVAGDFIVDVGEFIIENVEMVFSGCSKLRFYPSSNLNSIQILDSYLHSCDDILWGGIDIDGSKNDDLFMFRSLLEDAFVGVHSINCAKVRIEKSNLNKNAKHLEFERCNAETVSPLEMDGVTLSCNKQQPNPPSFPPPILLGDYSYIEKIKAEGACSASYYDKTENNSTSSNYITSIAVHLKQVNYINFTGPINRNYFESAYRGIYAENANYVVNECSFLNILRSYDPAGSDPSQTFSDFGSCIYQTSGNIRANASNPVKRWAGFIEVNNCTFRNFYRGVNITSTGVLNSTTGVSTITGTISNNLFENTNYSGSLYGNQVMFASDCGVNIFNVDGLVFRPNSSSPYTTYGLNILNNKILNLNNGISTKNTSTFLNIRENQINSYDLDGLNFQASRFLFKAISVANNQSGIRRVTYSPFGSLNITTTYLPHTASITKNTLGHDGDGFSSNLTLGNPYVGITANSVPRVLISALNYVWAPYDETLTNYGQQYGINVQSCNGANVIENFVGRDIGVLNVGSTSPHSGIRLYLSPSSIVCSNSINNFANGLVLNGNSAGTTISCNNFGSTYRGIYFINGSVGSQGNNNIPSDNSWLDEPGSGLRISGVLYFPNTNHNWFHRSDSFMPEYDLDANAVTGTNVFVSDLNNTPFYFNTIVSNNIFTSLLEVPCQNGCSYTWQGFAGEGGSLRRAEEFTSAIRDSLFQNFIYEFDIDSLYTSKWQSRFSEVESNWQILNQDTTWLDFGVSEDSLYRAFYNNMRNNVIGNLNELEDDLVISGVDSLIWNEVATTAGSDDSLFVNGLNALKFANLQAAKIALSGTSTSSNLEDALKGVITVQFDLKDTEIGELTSGQKSTCGAYAYSTSGEYGKATHIAQALLDTIVSDPVTPAPRLSNTTKEKFSNEKIRIFPNPTNGALTIQLDSESGEFSLYSLTGQLMISKSLSMNSTISLYDFAAGTYLIEVRTKMGIVKRERIVLIH